MNADRWHQIVAALLGVAPPPLPELPGRVHRAHDEPIADEHLVGITNCTELALVLGITRQAAHQRLQRQQTLARPAAGPDEGELQPPAKGLTA